MKLPQVPPGFFAFSKHRGYSIPISIVGDGHIKRFKSHLWDWNRLSSAEKQVFVAEETALIERHKIVLLILLESDWRAFVRTIHQFGITPGEWLVRFSLEMHIVTAFQRFEPINWTYTILPIGLFLPYPSYIFRDETRVIKYVNVHQRRFFQNIVMAFAPTTIHDHVLVTIVDYVISNSWPRYEKMQFIDRCRKMFPAKTGAAKN